MRQKNNSFIDNINRAREAASARPQNATRDLSSLSEQELDMELEKAKQRLNEAKRRELAATRQAADSIGPTPKALFAGRRQTRRPWK